MQVVREAAWRKYTPAAESITPESLLSMCADRRDLDGWSAVGLQGLGMQEVGLLDSLRVVLFYESRHVRRVCEWLLDQATRSLQVLVSNTATLEHSNIVQSSSPVHKQEWFTFSVKDVNVGHLLYHVYASMSY